MSELLGQWGDDARTLVLFLLGFSWQSSVLIAVAFGVMRLLRIRGVAVRHFVLVCALMGIGVLPLLTLLYPRVGMSRFALQSVSEGGGRIVQRIERAVLHYGRDQGGTEHEEAIRGGSSPSAAGPTEMGPEGKGDTRPSGEPWFRAVVNGLRLYGYPFLLGVWGVGVLFSLFRVFWGYLILRRMRASSHVVTNASVLAAYEEALSTVQVRRTPRLLASGGIAAPMAVGLWEPTILVPDTLGRMLSSEKIRMVLVHELVHVKGYDVWFDLYQRLLTAAWFFHPLVRYLSRKVGQACEDRCDAVVLAGTASPAAYARALMELLEKASDPRTWLPAVAGLQCRSRLGLRVGEILDGIPLGSLPRWGMPVGVMVTCILVGLLSSITVLSGSDALPGAGSVSISGIVLDPTGIPVEDARVQASRGGNWRSWGQGTTGTDGRFRIEGLLSGTFVTGAIVQGYAPTVALDVPGDTEDLELVLSEGGAIAGRVISEGGIPVPQVRVTADYHSNAVYPVGVWSDDDGIYRIPNLAEGLYHVRVDVRYSPSVYGRFVANPGEPNRIVWVQEGETTEGVDFSLVPGRSVSGHVRYQKTGKPPAGIPLALMGRDRMDTVTDEEGGYVFRGVPPGRYGIATDLEGYMTPPRRWFEVTIERDVQDMDVVLIRKGAVSVMVRDEEGHSISDARVWYGGGKEISGMREESVLQTDGKGRCRFEEVYTEWPELEVLWVDHSEYAFSLLLEEPIEEGEDRKVEVTLSRGGTLRGRVMDWEGKPVSGARIRILRPEEYPIWWYPGTARSVFTDDSGEYRAEHLPRGALRIAADHPEPRFVAEEFTAEVYEGEVATQDVTVQQGGTLMGRVVDRQGRPVRGIKIEILRRRGVYPWEIRTDRDGFYRADHLTPGEYNVSPRMPYHSWYPAGEEAKRVRVIERRVAQVDLTVESDEAGPLP